MEAATGLRSIPTLVDGDTVVHGADAIIAYLDERHEEPTDARRHRAQMRAEWPHWVELEGSGLGRRATGGAAPHEPARPRCSRAQDGRLAHERRRHDRARPRAGRGAGAARPVRSRSRASSRCSVPIRLCPDAIASGSDSSSAFFAPAENGMWPFVGSGSRPAAEATSVSTSAQVRPQRSSIVAPRRVGPGGEDAEEQVLGVHVVVTHSPRRDLRRDDGATRIGSEARHLRSAHGPSCASTAVAGRRRSAVVRPGARRRGRIRSAPTSSRRGAPPRRSGRRAGRPGWWSSEHTSRAAATRASGSSPSTRSSTRAIRPSRSMASIRS